MQTITRQTFRNAILMSALGQKPTYAVQKAMSSLPPKADMCAAKANVRYGPKADIISFDDFVGGSEHVRWEF
jgi:hypothetical protein